MYTQALHVVLYIYIYQRVSRLTMDQLCKLQMQCSCSAEPSIRITKYNLMKVHTILMFRLMYRQLHYLFLSLNCMFGINQLAGGAVVKTFFKAFSISASKLSAVLSICVTVSLRVLNFVSVNSRSVSPRLILILHRTEIKSVVSVLIFKASSLATDFTAVLIASYKEQIE